MIRPSLKLKSLFSQAGLMGLVLAAGLGLSLGLALLIAPAHGAERLALKAQTADVNGDGKVSLGEVFDNAGASADIAIAEGRSPTLVLDAARVQLLAQSLGLYWDNPNGLRRIIVTMGQGAQSVARTAFVATPLPGQVPQTQAVTQTVVATPVSVVNPVVIKRGDTVSVTWRTQGISLRASGIAQRDARLGERTTLINATSKKPIEDVLITGPGQGETGPMAQTIPALASR